MPVNCFGVPRTVRVYGGRSEGRRLISSQIFMTSANLWQKCILKI